MALTETIANASSDQATTKWGFGGPPPKWATTNASSDQEVRAGYCVPSRDDQINPKFVIKDFKNLYRPNNPDRTKSVSIQFTKKNLEQWRDLKSEGDQPKLLIPSEFSGPSASWNLVPNLLIDVQSWNSAIREVREFLQGDIRHSRWAIWKVTLVYNNSSPNDRRNPGVGSLRVRTVLHDDIYFKSDKKDDAYQREILLLKPFVFDEL